LKDEGFTPGLHLVYTCGLKDEGGRLPPLAEGNQTGQLPSPKEPSCGSTIFDPQRNGTASRMHAGRARHPEGSRHTNMDRSTRKGRGPIQPPISTAPSSERISHIELADRLGPVPTSHCGHAAPIRHGTGTSERSRHPEWISHLELAGRQAYAPRSQGFSPTRNLSPRRLGLKEAFGTDLAPRNRGLIGTVSHLGHTVPVPGRHGSRTSDWKEQPVRSCASGSPHSWHSSAVTTSPVSRFLICPYLHYLSLYQEGV
jgi:hypothetical protein